MSSSEASSTAAVRSRIVPFTAWGIVIAALLLTLWRQYGPPSGTDPGLSDARVGSEAPPFTLRTFDEATPFALADAHGKVVAIDFWATYCGPCRVAMPHLESVHRRYLPDDFLLVSVNVDPPSDDRDTLISDFVHRYGLTFPVLADTGQASYLYQANRIPLLILVGRDGTIRRIYRGTTDTRWIDRALDELIAEPRPG